MGELVAVTTVVRRAEADAPSSWLRVVDMDGVGVIRSIALSESEYRPDDPNPRGGLRGARGVSGHGTRLAVATSDRFHVYDGDWDSTHDVTHPLLGGVHGIYACEAGLWATATASDTLLRFSWDGELLQQWGWRDDHALSERLFTGLRIPALPERDFRVPSIGAAADDLVHANSVAPDSDGGLLVGLGQVLEARALKAQARTLKATRALASAPGGGRVLARLRGHRDSARATADIPAPAKSGRYAIVKLRAEGQDLVAELRHSVSGTAVPNHDAQSWAPGQIVYCDSNRSQVCEVDGGGARPIAEVPADPPFARGLLRLSEENFLVGSQFPASVHLVHTSSRTVVKSIQLSGT